MKTTRKDFMSIEVFKYYTSIKPKINHNAKNMLSEIDNKLSKEEQEYFVKNNRIARLQNSWNWVQRPNAFNPPKGIEGHLCDKIIISKSQDIVKTIDNTGNDDIGDFEDIEDYFRLGATYTGYESYLIYNGYNILHAHRDRRGDWGDDAGFMIIVSEKDGKFNVHTPFISYNCDIQYIKIEEDLLSFDTKKEAIKFINNLAIDMNNLLINNDEDLFSSEEEYEEFNKYKEKYPTILRNKEVFDVVSQVFWTSAFFEYPFDTLIAMKHIELLNGYYDDYKKIGNLADFRLNGEDRFDRYDFDVIIEITD